MTSTARVATIGALLALIACGDDSGEAALEEPVVEPATTQEVSEPPEPPEPVEVEPAAEEAADPLATTLVERDGIHLTRLVTSAEIVDHGPGAPQQVFTKGTDEKAYCFFQLENPEATATRIMLSWVDPNGESPNPPSIIDVPAQQHFANYRYTGIDNRRVGELACLIQLDGREQLGRAPIRIVEVAAE